MSSESVPIEWKPPAKIEELFAATAGNKFAAINSPVAGAREEKDLPEGPAPVQLYSLATPNGLFVCNFSYSLNIMMRLSSSHDNVRFCFQVSRSASYLRSWVWTMTPMVKTIDISYKIRL